MRDNVVDELKQLRPDEESKKKMLEILKRFHAEDEEEDSMDEDGMLFLLKLILAFCQCFPPHMTILRSTNVGVWFLVCWRWRFIATAGCIAL